MNLPKFLAYVENLKSNLLSRKMPSINKGDYSLTDISYNFLNHNLSEYWDFCAGADAIVENIETNKNYINSMFQAYLSKLIKLSTKRDKLIAENAASQQISEIEHKIAAHYYFLYKIESTMQAVEGALASPHLTNNQKFEKFWEKRQWAIKESFDDCFGGNKTIHAVQVLDGTGDLIHFANWFREYCLRSEISNTTVIIGLGPRSDEDAVKEYLANLDDAHPLKKHHDMTISKGSMETVMYGAIFSPLVKGEKANSYRALYAISTPLFINFREFLNFPSIGLKTCLINEMGVETSHEKNLPENFYEFSFGIGADPHTKPIGFFFPKVKPVEKLETIIQRLSDNMKIKLFGESAIEWTQEQLLVQAKKINIICAYYSYGRNLAPLNKLLEDYKSNTVVFFTGIDSLPPLYYEVGVPASTKERRVVCGDLNSADYNDLMQLIRTDSKHWFISSGDNTFAQSIAIGKIPVFLHRKPACSDKEKAIDNFLLTLESIRNNMSPAKRVLIDEITHYTRVSYISRMPSIEARKFFTECVAPYICANFELSNNLAGLIINIENDFQEEFNLSITPWDKNKNESVKRIFTPMFEIRHYELGQPKIGSIARHSLKM